MYRKNVLILYSEAMGYTLACLKEVEKYSDKYNLHLLSWDNKKLTPFEISNSGFITCYKRSDFNDDNLLAFAIKLEPCAIFVSGWMDKGYVKVAKYFRKQNINTITFLDNQWCGSLKQKLATIFFAKYLRKNIFNKIWVSGLRQYEYARRLGFNYEDIEWGFYCADQKQFERIYTLRDKKVFSKSLLYLGRFHTVKNIKFLIDAFQNSKMLKEEWKLTLVGNGPELSDLKKLIQSNKNIQIKDFINPDKLTDELILHDVFCLPSTIEPWGVVVHEFAISGYPLLVSNHSGAGEHFVINGYNGFKFDPTNIEELIICLNKISVLSDQELKNFGRNSHTISKNITLEMWVNKFITLI